MITKEQREEINKLYNEIAANGIKYIAERELLKEVLIYFEKCVDRQVLFDSDRFVSDCVNVYGPNIHRYTLSKYRKGTGAYALVDSFFKDISWEDIACTAMNVLTDRKILTDDMILKE